MGVPFTTKDCFAVTGLSYTAGLAERGQRKVKADFDADAIILVRFEVDLAKLLEKCRAWHSLKFSKSDKIASKSLKFNNFI